MLVVISGGSAALVDDGDRQLARERLAVAVGDLHPDRVARLGLEVQDGGRPKLVARRRERAVVVAAGARDERERQRVAGVGVRRRERADGGAGRLILGDRRARQRDRRRRPVGRRWRWRWRWSRWWWRWSRWRSRWRRRVRHRQHLQREKRARPDLSARRDHPQLQPRVARRRLAERPPQGPRALLDPHAAEALQPSRHRASPQDACSRSWWRECGPPTVRACMTARSALTPMEPSFLYFVAAPAVSRPPPSRTTAILRPTAAARRRRDVLG